MFLKKPFFLLYKENSYILYNMSKNIYFTHNNSIFEHGFYHIMHTYVNYI